MALEREIEYFHKRLPELLKKHQGMFALVKGDTLVGLFRTVDEALAEGARRFGRESFLVRPVVEHEPEASIPALTLGLLHADLPHSAQR